MTDKRRRRGLYGGMDSPLEEFAVGDIVVRIGDPTKWVVQSCEMNSMDSDPWRFTLVERDDFRYTYGCRGIELCGEFVKVGNIYAEEVDNG